MSDHAATPWLDVPVEVFRHTSLKSRGRPLVTLQAHLGAPGHVVLDRATGACPHACDVGRRCDDADAKAEAACAAIGDHAAPE